MPSLLDLYRYLTNPDQLAHLLQTAFSGWAAYALLAAVVFSETGLLVGFFLPGDSFLFTIGVVAGFGQLNLALLILCLVAACFVGDNVGYFLGYRTGAKIFDRKDGVLFKQAYVTRTQAFFEKHGGKTIIYARFVPIVRTFTPFMAGVGRMPYSRFLTFSFFGGLGWVIAMTALGYSLGNLEIVRKNLEKAILLVILLSISPIILEYIKHRRSNKAPVAVGD